MFRQQFYLTATTLVLGFSSINAQATLTSYTSNGVDLVYSSVSNVTWTKDGNLLGSLFASQGFNTVVNSIIAVSPTITTSSNIYNPSGKYTLSSRDFSSNGQVTWFGAMAYVNYLNSIKLGGTNQWQLPTLANQDSNSVGYKFSTNGKAQGNEMAELFYIELGSKGYYDINGNRNAEYGIKDIANKFDNEQSEKYWSATDHERFSGYPYSFNTADGSQFTGSMNNMFFAWAMVKTTVSPVPLPAAAWLFATGLPIVAAAARRKKQSV